MDPTVLHLLILCCYGGVPFIDYAKLGTFEHQSSTSLDPTDWIAVDSSGSLLNDTIHPEILKQNPLLINLIPSNTSLDQCDLFNLTFSSTADENVFKIGQGHLFCRCPSSRTGVSCQNHKFESEKLIQKQKMLADPFAAYLVLTFIFICAMISVFLMMRGCFCDCFGGCKNPFKKPTDEPLDPVAVNRCLEVLNECEKKQNMEMNRPLISTISDGCTPYNNTIYHPSHPVSSALPRPCSPPPSYRSEHGSNEFLPGISSSNTQL